MKDQAIWLYRQFTRRQRTELFARLQEAKRLPIAILFYHRIADEHPNGWTMNCRDFARQLDWLQENYDIVSLAEAQRRIQSKSCDRPSVAITFDDGYADNVEFALPELVKRAIPATYFVATDFVRTGNPFPHDVEAGVPLAPNTIEQLRHFAEEGIQIGAHTRTHPDLGTIFDREQLAEEIGGSIADLQEWLGRPIDYFAFPFGLPANTSQLAVETLIELGVKGYCTAYGALNWPSSHGLHLRRVHADPGLECLKNWLTLDKRKLRDFARLPFDENTDAASLKNRATNAARDSRNNVEDLAESGMDESYAQSLYATSGKDA